MDIYKKERTKITIGTIIISLAIIVGIWTCLFVTDLLLFENDMPMLFVKTKIDDSRDKRITTEVGLGYYAHHIGLETEELYLFGTRIK